MEYDDKIEETKMLVWSNEPKCSCTNQGKPMLFEGQKVTFLSPSCRVHRTTFTSVNQPEIAERIVESWDGREKKRA